MYKVLYILIPLLIGGLPVSLVAVETAPRITDREIIERLTRLEEGQKHLTEAVTQLRHDTNAGLDRLFTLILGVIGAFAAIVASTIGFAIWDRRTMIRPFETKVQDINAELAHNRQGLQALLEALRSLSETDEKVAEVLRRFNLL